ncbi:hypothetical protein C4E15_29440 [Achromobacter spanius]|uniref:Uncharacterized protein n=1 Tax=Achromobacter spanius TaxID=217203 RepID=A0A2S5GI74_9BURK|nr:hypothetical protein [Achromobacter spanius]PPA72668.1 hypothetical protein C4E15_29440 [Achromobacter spanius]
MRFAYVDEDGRVLSAHNDDTLDRLPDGAVPLDETQFEERFGLRWTGTAWSQEDAPGGVVDKPRASVQVSRFQLFAALLELDELGAVLEWGETDAEPLHKLALDTSPVFSTSSETIAALAAARGWTDDYVVQLFERAARARA